MLAACSVLEILSASIFHHDPPLLRSTDRAWSLPAVFKGVRRCSDTQFQYLFLLIILLLGI